MTVARARWALPVLILGVVAGIVLCGWGTGNGVLSLGLAAIVVASYPFLRATRRKDFDPFEPVNGFAAYTVFTLLIRGLIDLHFGGPILSPRYNVADPSFRVLLGWTFWYTGLFMAAFLSGYYWRGTEALARGLPVFKVAETSAPSVSLGLVLSLAVSVPAAIYLRGRLGAAIAQGSYLAASRVGGVSGVSFALRFALVGAYLAVLYAARRRPLMPLVASASFALLVSLIVFALLPTKIVVANTLFVIVGAVHYLRRHVRVRNLLMAGLAGLLAMPALMAYRYGWTLQRLWELLRKLPDEPQLLLAGVFQRSFGADSFAVILDAVGQGHPFELGRTFGSLVWWWVPRALWAGKPFTYAIEFWETFLRQSAYFPQRVSASPTMIGELYLNFWWIGVVAGGVIAGCTYRLVYLWFRKQPRHEAAVLVYLLAVATLIKMVEGPIADHLTELFVNVSIGVAVGVGIPLVLAAARAAGSALSEGDDANARRD